MLGQLVDQPRFNRLKGCPIIFVKCFKALPGLFETQQNG